MAANSVDDEIAIGRRSRSANGEDRSLSSQSESSVWQKQARFFLSHGFTADQWQRLAAALRDHAKDNEITKRERTPLGERVVIEGPMRLPDQVVASVRVIWFLETGESAPRLATAYPIKQKQHNDQRT